MGFKIDSTTDRFVRVDDVTVSLVCMQHAWRLTKEGHVETV